MNTDVRVSSAVKALTAPAVLLSSFAVHAHPGPDHWHPENSAAILALGVVVAGAAAMVVLRRSGKASATRRDNEADRDA